MRQASSLCSPAAAIALSLAFGTEARAVTLDAVLDRTLEKNPAIQEAKARVEEAAGQRVVLRAIMWPDAKVVAPGGVQGGDRSGESGTKPFGFVRGFFNQALLNAAVPPTNRLADINVLIAEQQLNVAVVEQLHAARLAFYTAIYNRELGTIQQTQQQRLDANVAGEKSRYEAGVTKRNAVVEATVAASELGTESDTAQRAYSAARLKLAEAMGDNIDSDAKLPDAEGELQVAPVDVDLAAATARAIEQRPDLKLARLVARAANEQQRIVAAEYYPVVLGRILGDYVPVTGIHREGSTRRTEDFVGSEAREQVAYTWRLIDNGKVGGAVMTQRANREINELIVRQLEANVGRELSRIKNQLSALEEQQKSLASASTAADQSANVVAQNLAGGLASQLEYRLTQNGFLQTKTGVLTAVYEHNVARAEWDRATGSYFQFANEPSAH